MSIRSFRFVLPLLLLVWAPLAAAQDESYDSSDGATAAPGQWTVPGGSPAGGAEARVRPLRTLPALRWTYEADGTIVDEPLVWGDRVLIEVDRGRGRRSLWTIDLASGLPTCKPSHYKSKVTLSPAVWGGQIAVRSGPDKLELRTWTRDGLGTTRTFKAPGVGKPLIFQGEFYYTDSAGLHCVDRAAAEERALLEGQFGGRPRLRGGAVYVLERGPAETVVIVEAERGTLRRLRSQSLGRYKGELDDAAVIAFEEWVGVHVKGGLEPYAGTTIDGFVTLRPVVTDEWDFFDDYYGSGRPAENVRGIPATWRDGWVGWGRAREIEWEVKEDEKQQISSVQIKRGDRIDVLIAESEAGETLPIFADDDVHPAFTRLGPPPTVAGDVVYLDGHAIDLIHGRILWELDPRPVGRIVPAGNLLLMDLGDGKLSALGASSPAGDGVIPAPFDDPGAFQGRAVTLEGKVLEGETLFEGGKVKCGSKSAKLKDILVVEEESGRLLWAAGPEGARRGLRALAERELGVALVDLAKEACASNDIELLSKLSDQAASHGAQEKDLKSVAKAIKGLAKRPKPIDADVVEAVTEKAESLKVLPADAIVARVDKSPETLPIAVRLALLDEALAIDPDHDGAVAMVDQLLPGALKVGDAAAAREWIPFLRVIERFTVQVWSEDDSATPRHIKETLEDVSRGWNNDLVAFTSDNMLVISPPDRPGAVSRCVAMGELVCRALEDICSVGTTVRDEIDDKLIVKLFESREEYLRGGTGEVEPGLVWTAGYYDPDSKMSHLYLDDDEEGMEEAMRTFAHESTHHWLDVRCRLWEPMEAGSAMEQDGFWIVEGFACLVEDFLFDIDAQSWTTLNTRSSRLDTLSQLKGKEVLDWGELLSRSQIGFHKYDKSGGPMVTNSWYLGHVYEASEALRFYAQAAATTQWLYHADDGALRPQLVEFLVAYYGKQGGSLDKILGRSWEDIGKDIEAFARETVSRD